MRYLRNHDGIALVTSLMLTLISMTIVMALLYMVTQNIQMSSQQRKYHSAMEASYGGTEIFVKDILPYVLQNYSTSSMISTVTSNFNNVNLQINTTQECLQKKLTLSTKDWPPECSKTPEPKKSPDMNFTLQASAGNNFVVYSKIVDTVQGNTDQSGLQLEGSGVAESSSILRPQHFPYIYRLEIQGERQNNSAAQANIEVLYAY